MVNGQVAVETFTISWLPADGPVRPLKLRSEVGKNYSLEETFAIADSQRARVSMWGPYETDGQRYELAVAQSAVKPLQSASATVMIHERSQRSARYAIGMPRPQ